MKILFFTDGGYGVSPFLCDQLLSIKKEFSDVFAVIGATEQQPLLVQRIKSSGIDTLTLFGLQSHSNLKSDVDLLRKFITEKGVNVIHVQTNWELLLVQLSILGFKKKPKIIFTIHHFRNNKGWVKMQVARLIMGIALLLFSNKVIATCNFITKNFRIIKYKIVKIPLGVDDEYINRDFHAVIGSPKMVFPAMFREGKRQDLLIRAFAMYLAKTKDADAKLFLPGDGVYLSDCKKIAINLGVDSQIVFPGLLSKKELLSIYDKANILACSSISETYCQAIVEGGCLGKCILSTPVGIAPEIIINNVSGFIINNEEDLFKRLCFLKNNPDALLNICKNNYMIRENFCWKSITQFYLKVVKSL